MSKGVPELCCFGRLSLGNFSPYVQFEVVIDVFTLPNGHFEVASGIFDC